MSIQRSLIKFSLFSIFTILALNLASSTNAQVVCSLDELIRELYDDIIDNGNFLLFKNKIILFKNLLNFIILLLFILNKKFIKFEVLRNNKKTKKKFEINPFIYK